MQEVKGLVSVTVPFYNSERFLRETIESVLAQTYTHWELLLVDDAATDSSVEIARDYAARLPGKISYVEHPGHSNRGVTRSRNLGASKSRGEYLAFLDSDDVWLPNKLEHQVALMDANTEAGLLFGPSEYWYDWDADGNRQQKNHIPDLAPGGGLYLPPVLLTQSYPFGEYGSPGPSSFLLRRSAFDQIGGFVECFNPNTYQLYEDVAFLAKIYLNVPVIVSGRCTDRYRCHPSSIWHRVKGTNREESERRFYCRWLRQYLLEQKVESQDIWKVIRRKAWAYWLPLPSSVTKIVRRIDNRLSR